MEVVSLVASIGSLIGGVSAIATHLNNLRERYDNAALNVTLVAGSLWTVKAALEAIDEWRKTTNDSSKTSEQLDTDLTLSLEACACLISVIDRKLKDTDLDKPTRYAKARFVALDAIFKDFASNLDTQVRGLQLLLQVYQCRTLTERTEKLQRRDTRRVFNEVEHHTVSLNLEDSDLADAVSILSRDAPSVELEVDSILLNSPLYRRVYGDRYLRRLQRNSGIIVSPRHSLQIPEDAAGQIQPTHHRSRSRNSMTHPGFSLGPDLPFLGVPFSGEKVEDNSDLESDTESVRSSQPVEPVNQNDIEQTDVETIRNYQEKEEQRTRKFSFASEHGLESTFQRISEGNKLPSDTKAEVKNEQGAKVSESKPLSGEVSMTADLVSSGKPQDPSKHPDDFEHETTTGLEHGQEAPSSPTSQISDLYSASERGSVDDLDGDLDQYNNSRTESSNNDPDAAKTSEMLENEIHDMLGQVSSTADQESFETSTSTSTERQDSPKPLLLPATKIPATTEEMTKPKLNPEQMERESPQADSTGLKIDFGGEIDIGIKSPSSRRGSAQDQVETEKQDILDEADHPSSPLFPGPLVSSFREQVYHKNRDASPGRLSFDSSRVCTPNSTTMPAAQSSPSRNSISIKRKPAPSSPRSSDLLSPDFSPRENQRDSFNGPSILVRVESSKDSTVQTVEPSTSSRQNSTSHQSTLQSSVIGSKVTSEFTLQSTEHDGNDQGRDLSRESEGVTLPLVAPLRSPPVPEDIVRQQIISFEQEGSETLRSPRVRSRTESESANSPTVLHSSAGTDYTNELISKSGTQSAPPTMDAMRPPPLPRRPPPMPPTIETINEPTRQPPPIPGKIIPITTATPPKSPSSPLPPIPLQSSTSPQVEKILVNPLTRASSKVVRESRSATVSSEASMQRQSGETLSTRYSRDNASNNDAASIMTASTATTATRSSTGRRSTDTTSYQTNLASALTVPTFDSMRLDNDPEARQREKGKISGALQTHFGPSTSKDTGDKKPKLRHRLSGIFGSDKSARLRMLNEAARDGNIPLLENCLQECTPQEVQKLLILPDESTFAKTPLMRAATSGRVEVMEKLVKAGAGSEFAKTDHYGKIALHYAVETGQAESSKWLAERFRLVQTNTGVGMPPGPLEISDRDGRGSLALAAATGRVDIIQILIKYGARLEGGDNMQRTPLLVAILSKHVDAARCLVGYGANVNRRDKNEETPLMYASRLGLEDIVTTLLENKADRNAQDCNGDYAVHHAARNGRVEIIEKLYLSIDDLEVKNHIGERPLHVAAGANSHIVAKALLRIGCNANAWTEPPAKGSRLQSTKKVTSLPSSAPLHYACRNGHFDVANDLILFGALPDSNLEDGTSPLMLACEALDLATVVLLLQSGVNVNAQTSADHNTALHMAMLKKGSLDIVKQLLDYGANHKLCNKKLETPYNNAFKQNSSDPEVLSHIRNHELLVMKMHRRPQTGQLQSGTGRGQHVPSVPSHAFYGASHPGMPGYGGYPVMVPAQGAYSGMVPYAAFPPQQTTPPTGATSQQGAYSVADGGVRLDPSSGWYDPQLDTSPDVAPPAYNTLPPRQVSKNNR